MESRSNPPKNILSSLPDGQTCTNYKHSKKYKLFVGLSIPLTPIIHHQHHRLSVCVCVWCWHFFVYESVTPVKSVQLWQLYRFFLLFSGSQLTRLNVVIRIIANKERERGRKRCTETPYCCSSVAGDQLGGHCSVCI